MRKYLYNYCVILLIAGTVVAIDLFTKQLAGIMLNESTYEVIPHVLTFVYVKNTGAAFSMFSNSTSLLAGFSILFILIFFVVDYFTKDKNVMYYLGMSFVIGGAVGNLIDRLSLHYVRDFISLKLFDFIFNMADFFITIGIILYAIYLLMCMIKDKQEADHVK